MASDIVGKVPPQALENEDAVLSAILLDPSCVDEVMEELTKLNHEGTTIMLVTHDVKVAAKCTRVMYIVDGNIKGEYSLDKYENASQMRERERALNNWLLELGW